MKSELPGIDAIIDEAICQVRERLAETDESIISDFIDEFVDRHPDMALSGVAYHLGLMVVIRANCARDEFNQSLVAATKYVETRPKKLGGTPVLKGTRFSLSQLFAELADSDAVKDIAVDFDLDADQLQSCLHAFALFFYDRPA